MDPPPVRIRARWPAHRRLVTDAASACGAAGAVAGYVLFGRPGIVAAAAGAALGALAGALVGPRRYHLTLDHSGVRVGRLTGTIHIPWNEVVAVGIEDGWLGRRGVTVALAVGRRGDTWPITVPALAYHAGGFRIGGVPPREQLAPHRAQLLADIRPWAQARSVAVVDADIDDWWDRNRAVVD